MSRQKEKQLHRGSTGDTERENELHRERLASHSWGAAQTSYSGQRVAGRYASSPLEHATVASNRSGGAAPPARPPPSGVEEILISHERNSAQKRACPQSQHYIRPPAARHGPPPLWNAGSKLSSTSTGAAASFRQEPEAFSRTITQPTRNARTTHRRTASRGVASSFRPEPAAFFPTIARSSRAERATHGPTSNAGGASSFGAEPTAFFPRREPASRNERATQGRTTGATAVSSLREERVAFSPTTARTLRRECATHVRTTRTGVASSFGAESAAFSPERARSSRRERATHGRTMGLGAASSFREEPGACSPRRARSSRDERATHGRTTRTGAVSSLLEVRTAFSLTITRSPHDGRATHGCTPSRLQHGIQAPFDRSTQAPHWNAVPSTSVASADIGPVRRSSLAKYQVAARARERLFPRESCTTHDVVTAQLPFQAQHSPAHCVAAPARHQGATNTSTIDRSHTRHAGTSPISTRRTAFAARPPVDGVRDFRLPSDERDNKKHSSTCLQPSRQPPITRHEMAPSRHNLSAGPLTSNVASADTIHMSFPSDGYGECRYSPVPPHQVRCLPAIRAVAGRPQHNHMANLPWDSRHYSEARHAGVTPAPPLASRTFDAAVRNGGACVSREWRPAEERSGFHQHHDRRVPSEQKPWPLHDAISNTTSLGSDPAHTYRAAVTGRPTVRVPTTTADAINRAASTAAALVSRRTDNKTLKGAFRDELREAAAFAHLQHRGLRIPEEISTELTLRGDATGVHIPKLPATTGRPLAAVAVSLPKADNAVAPLRRAKAADAFQSTDRATVPVAPQSKTPHPAAVSRRPSGGAGPVQTGEHAAPAKQTFSASAKADIPAVPPNIPCAGFKPDNPPASLTFAAPLRLWDTSTSERYSIPSAAVGPLKSATADARHDASGLLRAQVTSPHPKTLSPVELLKGASGTRPLKDDGSDRSSKVVQDAPFKVVTIAVPEQATPTPLGPPQAADHTQFSKDVPESPPSQGPGCARDPRLGVAASGKGEGGAAHPKAVVAVLSKTTIGAASRNAGVIASQPSRVVCSLPQKASSAAPVSKAAGASAAMSAVDAPGVTRPKTCAASERTISPEKCCVPRRPARPQMKQPKDTVKHRQMRQRSPSCTSSSSSSTSSSTSDSSTGSLTSSDSDSSSETSSSSDSESTSTFDTDSDSHPGSRAVRQSVTSKGSSPSASNRCRTVFPTKKETCTRKQIRRQKGTVCLPLQRPAVAIRSAKAEAPRVKVGALVGSKNKQADRPLKACKNLNDNRNIQISVDDPRQNIQNRVVIGNNAENSNIVRCRKKAVVSVKTKKANDSREQVLLSSSEAPGTVQLNPPDEAFVYQQKKGMSVSQAEKIPASTPGELGCRVATVEDVTQQLKSKALASGSILRERVSQHTLEEGEATRSSEPAKIMRADGVQPLVPLAALPKRKPCCKRVQNRDGTTQKNATLRSGPKSKEDISDIAARLENISAGGCSSKKQSTGIVDRTVFAVVTAPHVHPGASGVTTDVKIPAATAATRTARTAGDHPTPASQRSPLRRITTARPPVGAASASPTMTPAEPSSAQKTLPSNEAPAHFRACTVSSPLTLSRTQATGSLALAPAVPVPGSLTTNITDSTECKFTIIDPPCACELTPPGLVNLGKTCSFNALLQALSATCVFSEFCNELNFLKMHTTPIMVAATSAGTAGMNVAAAAPDYSGDTECSNADFVRVRKETKKKDVLIAGADEAVNKGKTDSLKHQHQHHESHTCVSSASALCAERDSCHMTDSLPHVSTQDGDPTRNINSPDLAVSSSLAAILYQMCNGICFNDNIEGHNADVPTKTLAGAPAANEQRQVQRGRKQLRLLQQLRTKKWYEQQGGVLNPTNFVTQVKMLNAEFQHDAELDVEEVWRFIVDRLLQEADDECRRLALLLQDASSCPDQEAGKTDTLGGNCRAETEPDQFLLHSRSNEKTGYASRDNEVRPPCSLRRSPEIALEERTRIIIPVSTPLQQFRSDADSTKVRGLRGRECADEKEMSSVSIVSTGHVPQGPSPATDDSSSRCAKSIGSSFVLYESIFQQSRHHTQRQQGREKEQHGVGGTTLCIAKVANDCVDVNSRRLTASSRVWKVRDNALDEEDASILRKGLGPVISTQECRCWVDIDGPHASGQGNRRIESPCTPADACRGGGNCDEVGNNCVLAEDTLKCASSSPQLTSSSERSGNPSPVENQLEQTRAEEITTRLRAALRVSRRLQNALTGKLVHVPVACSCCCSCPGSVVPCSTVPVCTNSLSYGDSDSSTTFPLPQTNPQSGSSCSSTSTSISSGNANSSTSSTYVHNGNALLLWWRTPHSGCSRNTCAGELYCRLCQGGVKEGNQRSSDSNSSSQGTCETNTGFPASCDSGNKNSGPQGKVVDKDPCTCTEEAERRSKLGMRKRRRRLRRPPRDSESESEARDRCSVVEPRSAASIPERTVAEAESESVKKPFTELSSETHQSEGQGVVLSSGDAISKNDICSNQSAVPDVTASGDIVLHSASDGTPDAQQRVQEICERPRSSPPTIRESCMPVHENPVDTPAAMSLSHPRLQVVASVENLASSTTSGFLPACNSTGVSTRFVSRTESVSKCSPAFAPPREATLLLPSISAIEEHEEKFSAGLSLRLPERSRWMASRPQGAQRMSQARSAQAARSRTQEKEGPITLEECLSLALEHRCNGERAVNAAQKTVVCARRGRLRAPANNRAQQSRCRQRCPRGRKVPEEAGLNGPDLCSMCGKFARQLCHGTSIDGKSSSGCEIAAQRPETVVAASARGSPLHEKDPDEVLTSSVNELHQRCATVHTREEATRNIDVERAGPTTGSSGSPLVCHYCKRVHTKTYLGHLPHLLVLQLQRSCPAETSGRQASRGAALAFTGGGIKIKAHVQFPDELQHTLLPHCERPVHDRKIPSVPSAATNAGVKQRCKRGKSASRTPSAPQASFGGSCSQSSSSSSVPRFSWFSSVLPSRSFVQAKESPTPSQSSTVRTSEPTHEATMPTTLKPTRGVYKLRAVIEHQGRSGTGGHYVCFRRGFTCRSLSRTSVQGLPIPSPVGTAPCASADTLTGCSKRCGTIPLVSIASSGASSAFAGTTSDATASSDTVRSIHHCSPAPLASATYHFGKIDQASPELNGAETPRSHSFRASACPASAAACVRQAHQQDMLTARIVQVNPATEEQNPMSHCVPTGDDRQSRQARIDTRWKENPRSNKRLRAEDQGVADVVEEAENRLEAGASEERSPAHSSSPRKRHCTDSAQSRDQEEHKGLPSFPSTPWSAHAGHGELLGGKPAAVGKAEQNRRCKKGEAEPTERDLLNEQEDWWEVNDTQACRTTWHQVSLCQAYLLIYELERPVHAMCRKRHLRASLQAPQLKEEKKSEEQSANGRQKTAKEAAKNADVKLTRSTSRTVSTRRTNKPTAATRGTDRTARGRKRTRSAQADGSQVKSATRRVEPLKRQKKH